jgi:transposase
MTRDGLERLSKDDLIALVLAQAAQIEALTKRMAELEARLGKPAKTPDNSSRPPSQGEKANRPDQPRKPRAGRPGTLARSQQSCHTVSG